MFLEGSITRQKEATIRSLKWILDLANTEQKRKEDAVFLLRTLAAEEAFRVSKASSTEFGR
ncbi:MAG: hypothetical protein QXI39_03365 [Candidatus Bathyarchaeia archaeon]